MKDYSEASDLIHEIERALSLGEKASADTAIRKLQSLTRNNANTNYGSRLGLAQTLEEQGGTPFISDLSGQALNALAPRGLGKLAASGTALSSFSNPYMLAALPFQSPRLMGESAYALGRAKGATNNLLDKIDPKYRNALLQIMQKSAIPATTNESQK